MDQRRSKKIILLYVLFSLLFVTLVMVQNLRMRSELLQDQQATLALLNKEESFSEAKLIEGFDEPKTADLIAEGKKLETKYGLLGKMSLAHLLNTFIFCNFAVFSLGWLLFSLLFYWLLRKKERFIIN